MGKVTFERSAEFEGIVRALIDSEQSLAYLHDCRIVCVVSDSTKKDEDKRPMYAECEKVPNKFSWATTADFMITVYSPNIAYFNDGMKQILMFRELLKIEPKEGEAGRMQFELRGYDLKDFRMIVDRFGPDWDKGNTLFD